MHPVAVKVRRGCGSSARGDGSTRLPTLGRPHAVASKRPADLWQLRVVLGVEAASGSRFGLPARAVGWRCRGLETMNKRLKALDDTSAREHMLTEVQRSQ
jgi:hypothetical protein